MMEQWIFFSDGCNNCQGERLRLIHSRSMLTHADTVAVRVVFLVAGTLGWFVTRVDQKTIFFHAALESHEEVGMKTPIGLWQGRFMIKATLWISEKELCSFVPPRNYGISHEVFCWLCQ